MALGDLMFLRLWDELFLIETILSLEMDDRNGKRDIIVKFKSGEVKVHHCGDDYEFEATLEAAHEQLKALGLAA